MSTLPARRRTGALPLRAAVLAIAVAVTLLAGVTPAHAARAYANVTEIEANTFDAAGVAVSQRVFPDGAGGVVLTTNANFPDALAASAVATAVGGPVLFTAPDVLPDATRAELDRLLEPGDTVTLLGGTQAVSQAVADAVTAAGYGVNRIAGETRLETAAAAASLVGLPADGTVIVARAFGPDGANTESDRTTGWVDAISCGAYAADARVPVLLTETDVLSAATQAAITQLGATDAIVCGGTVAVGPGPESTLSNMGLDLQRVAGVTRVETAIAGATQLFGHGSAAGHTYLLVPGYGPNYGYGLAATPLAAQLDAPILLVGAAEPTSCEDQTQPSRETLCFLQTAGDNTADLVVVGDASVIGDPVADAAGAAAGGEVIEDVDVLEPPATVAVADTSNDDGTRLKATWTASEDPEGILDGYRVYVDGTAVDDGALVDGLELELDGLPRESEVDIEVTAVDRLERESARSDRATGTPDDEAPPAPLMAAAAAGDGRAVVTWGAPVSLDLTSYQVRRAAASDCNAMGTTYATIAETLPATTLTYTDEDAANGTAYCYRVLAGDAANQRSAPATAGPVTPAPGIPTIEILQPVGVAENDNIGDPDTVHYPSYPVMYEVSDSDTPLNLLTVTLELSVNGGQSYTAASGGGVLYDAMHLGGTNAVGTFNWTTVPDLDQDDVRIRASVIDPDGNSSPRVTTLNFESDDNPAPVTALGAVSGNDTVIVSWDRHPAFPAIVTSYRIMRAEVQVLADADSEDVCGENAMYQPLEAAYVPPAGPKATYIDGNVRDGQTPVDDYRYCYQVAAHRTAGKDLFSSDAEASANPSGIAPSVSLTAPPDDSNVPRGRTYPIRFTIGVPDGTTANRVLLDFCRDYEQPLIGSASCTEDWVAIATVATPSAADYTVQWAVPANDSTSQGDEETGAVRARVYATAGQADASPSGSSINDGIVFTGA